MAIYAEHGIRLEYPEGWTLSATKDEDAVNVHLQTTGAAFWTLTLLPASIHVGDAVDAVVAAFEDEYADLHCDNDPLEFDGVRSAGCDVEFSCFDLFSSARIRAVAMEDATALVVYQGEDRELDNLRPQLEAVTASLMASTDSPPDAG